MWRHDFFEKILRKNGYHNIAGVDEVGRGALAGPVVAAAVVLEEGVNREGIRDSKTLTARQREQLATRLRREALGIGLGSISETEIDRINILQATYKAMHQAIANLPVSPDIVLVDGFWLPDLPMACIGIVKGDSRSYSVAAASIVAKVHRDALLTSLAAEYPAYGFDRHKGYGTPQHLKAIAQHGPCPCHRCSFQGVRPPGGIYGSG
jgi:ribonuclease HII